MSESDEADESDIAKICDSTEKLHVSTRLKSHVHKASRTRQRDHEQRQNRTRLRYDYDPPYTVSPSSSDSNILPSCTSNWNSTHLDSNILPSSTSNWNTTHLDSLRIHYDDMPRPIDSLLNMVFEETGMFHPLTESQTHLVTRVQESMTFSCNLSDVLEFALVSSDFPSFKPEPNVYEDVLKHVEAEDLWNDGTSHELVQVFVTHIVMIIQWMMTNKTLPEAVFQDMFKIFINMCGLISSDGKAWKTEKLLLGKKMKSEADIAITTRQPVEASNISRNLFTLVSIVKVKNLTHYREDSPENLEKSRPPIRKSSSAESSEGERSIDHNPHIFHQVDTDVLGQHGGELLTHTDKYGENLSKNNFFYRPGVIVIGTKVTVTLLVCSVKYWLEIRTRNAVEKEKAIIYYSDQKDLLNKEDRDSLIESLARLKNSCQSK